MKKLKLEIEELAVETFDPSAPGGEKGTVVGLSGHYGGGCTYDPIICASHQYGPATECNGFTLDRFDSRCYDSWYEGNCTGVCPSGWAVCDTSPEACG